ncbi:histone acetyltransferase type B subunit 2-like isoform X2 [Rutidosis leptorrhynchoides]
MEAKSCDLLLSKNYIYVSQGPRVQIMSIDKLLEGTTSIVSSLNDHRARITSMRLFPLKETSLFRNAAQINENVLVTSSCDHSIRLWWKGSFHRSFRGHNGPVTVLSDKLLGDGNGKVFASGGEDSTVRLWSLSSSGKNGQRALKATLYGHEKPIVLLSVTGHKESFLVSMSKDSKVRVWDVSVSSSSDRKSSCVGTTSVVGVPVGIKCHNSLIYIAAGSTIEAVDLRTMKTSFRTSTKNQGKLYSFDINPSKFLACAGGHGRAMLWDIRKITDTGEGDPMAELDGHIGPVTHLHMDPYKIVTGGREDPQVNIWEADNGNQTNVLSCTKDESGCSAMAVDGFRIVTAGYNQDLRFRDFSNAVSSVSFDDESFDDEVTGLKFWCPSNSGDDANLSD